jgi:hypothetical protein
MTATDGYNDVLFVAEWDKRSKTGWTTSMAFLAQLHPGQIVPFAAETRYNDHARQLAILIDRSRPGERLPAKLQQETGLVARGYRVTEL